MSALGVFFSVMIFIECFASIVYIFCVLLCVLNLSALYVIFSFSQCYGNSGVFCLPCVFCLCVLCGKVSYAIHVFPPEATTVMYLVCVNHQ